MTAIDTTTLINNLNATQSSSANESTSSSSDIGKEEFLTMLVAQLQNQDPLDPMSNEDFAVNLAQFSQLEQLIDIKGQLEDLNTTSSTDTLSSMSSYLGQKVILNGNSTTVNGCNAGEISFNLSSDVESLTVSLLNSNGTEVASVDFEELEAGFQSINLGNVGLADGEYEIQINATTSTGVQLNPSGFSSGVVDGFIPGDTPTLLVNGHEVTLDKVKEVRLLNDTSIN